MMDAGSDGAAPDTGVLGHDAEADSGNDESQVGCLGDPIGAGDTLLSLHTSTPEVQASSNRLLSVDRRWIVRDRATLAIVATGVGAVAHLHDDWIALRSATLLEVRRALDGTVAWSTAIDSGLGARSGISLDGSYVWLATESAVRAFELTTGRELLSHAGNYAAAQVIARADELRIVGQHGQAERVSLAGASTVVATAGTPREWSADGRHLMSLRSAAHPNEMTVDVYDANGALEDSFTMSEYGTFGAYGDYVWARVATQGATVWRLGDENGPRLQTRPLVSFADGPSQSGSWFAFPEQGETWTLVDLSQSTLAPRTISSAYAYGFKFAMAGRDLYFGDLDGVYVIPDGAERATRVTCGAVTDVALSKTGMFALSVGTKQVLLGDLRTRAVRAVLPGGQQLAFDREGDVLGMIDESLRLSLFDARSGALLLQESAPATNPFRPSVGYDLSADGSRYMVTTCQQRDCQTQIVDRRGGRDALPKYDAPAPLEPMIPRLAPGGTQGAYASGSYQSETVTNLLRGASAAGKTPGYPLLWLDDSRLLVNRYVLAEGGNGYAYETYLVSDQGASLGKLSSKIEDPRLISLRQGSFVFSRTTGRIYQIAGDNADPVLQIGDGSIYGDANDDQVLYVPLQGPTVGELRLRTYEP